MERREFIKKLSLLSIPFIFPLSNLFGKSTKKGVKITILHTNDTHSRLDPYPKGNGKKSGMGGVSKRSSLIKMIKAYNPNTILLDAGDCFQGTPYFNFYEGKLEYETMSMLEYNYGTIGNHEFDLGTEKLLKAMEYLNFPLLSANYTSNNPKFKKHVKPYDIININGIKIGIVGLGIDFDGLVGKEFHKEIEYKSYFKTAKEHLSILDKAGVTYKILLTHIGVDSDIYLAKKLKGINLIVGGHSHTTLRKPIKIGDTLIVQTGASGINLGKLDLNFYNGEYKNFKYKLIPVK